MPADPPNEELLHRAQSGDAGATAELLANYGSLLLRRLENRLRLSPFADFSPEDVLQEAFVDVFRGISSFDPERGSFQAWLTRVADNRLAMFLRNRNRKKRGGQALRVHADNSSIIRILNDIDDPAATTGSENCATEEARKAIELCIASLPEAQQEAVRRYYLNHQTIDTVADSMGITKEAVRGLLHRAKKSMRTMMGNSSLWFR